MSSKYGGRNLHLFRATVITSDNGVDSGSGWSLPSQYCTQTARVSVWSGDSARGAAVTCVWCLHIRNASRPKLTRIMRMDSARIAQ
jgi:hypothetical protein